MTWNYTVDLGCGFLERQRSDEQAVGIDINFEHGRLKTAYPILADVQHIPIKSGSVKHVYARMILEHLPNAHLCLNDMKRIMKDSATGTIHIPIESNLPRQIAKRFVKEFPFSMRWVVEKLWRSITLWRKCPEMVHCTQVNISDLEKYFRVNHDGITSHRRLHKWFVHFGPFTILARLGILNSRLTVDEYADFTIPIVQKVVQTDG